MFNVTITFKPRNGAKQKDRVTGLLMVRCHRKQNSPENQTLRAS
jgi:hypothetical protein